MCSNRQGLYIHMKRQQLSKLPRKPESLAPCHFLYACATASHTHLSFPSSILPHTHTCTHIWSQGNKHSRTQAIRSLNFSLGKSGLSRLRKYIFSTPATELMSWLFSSSVKGSLPGKQSLPWECIHGDRSFSLKAVIFTFEHWAFKKYLLLNNHNFNCFNLRETVNLYLGHCYLFILYLYIYIFKRFFFPKIFTNYRVSVTNLFI